MKKQKLETVNRKQKKGKHYRKNTNHKINKK